METGEAAPVATPRRADLYAGLILLGVLALVMALGAVDVWKRRADLQPLVPGDMAPSFSLPTVDGTGKLALEDLRGKVVLVDFWATWCPPCLREMPELAELHRSLADRGFTVVGINREPEAAEKVRAFVRGRDLPFPLVLDTEDVGGSRYRLVSLPMTVLVDRQGKIARQFMGYTDPAVMRAAVLKVLDQPAGG